MTVILRLFGWAGVALAAFNIWIRVSGTDAEVARYAGGSRNLDATFLLLGFCLVLLALEAILIELRKLNKKDHQ